MDSSGGEEARLPAQAPLSRGGGGGEGDGEEGDGEEEIGVDRELESMLEERLGEGLSTD